MPILKSLVKNTLARTVTELINRFGSALFWVFVARQLGASALGALAFGMSLFSFFLTVSTFGLGSVVVREVARDHRQAGAYLGHTLALGSASAFIMMALMMGTTLIINPNRGTIQAACLLAVAILPASWFYWSKSLLSALEEMQLIAVARFLENLFKVVFGLIALFMGAHLVVIAMVITMSKIVSAIIVLLFAARRARPQFRLQPHIVSTLRRMTPSFSLIALFNSLFWAAPVIILTRLGGEVQAGYFSAAFKLVDMIITFAHAYGQALFPIASRTARHNAEVFRMLFLKSIKYVSILTFAIAAAVSVLASDIVGIVYGAGMAEVAKVLRILIWMVVPFSIVPILAYSLMSHDQQVRDLISNCAAALAVILLGIVTSPMLGATGMAGSVVTACLVFWGFEFVSVQQTVFSFSIGEQVWRPALAAIVLALLLTVTHNLNLILSGGLAAGGYLLFLLLSRTVTMQEWKMVKQLESIH